MTRTALALEYFPDLAPRTARRRLTNWIHCCPELYARLSGGPQKFDGRQHLTAREVKLIKQFLGDP